MRKARLPLQHRIPKTEAIDFMQKNFKAKLADEE
jgi:hypothetical protein